MATGDYIQGRFRWSRPQAMLWSNDPGTVDELTGGGSLFVPQGTTEGQDFIIISDHNREEIGMSTQRIESRTRMINGTMRSYHTADKINLSTSWSRLPSRSYSDMMYFDSNGKPVAVNNPYDLGEDDSPITYRPTDATNTVEYTVDGGAGGVQLLEWYENHPGPFYVYLAYDKYTNFSGTGQYHHLHQYSQVLHMYFSSFEYNIEKRGANNYDMWNISVSLEEV